MENFYLIPINDRDVFIEGINMVEYLEKNYESVYQLYEIKHDLIRKTNQHRADIVRRKCYEANNKQIELFSEQYQVPLYLIAYGSKQNAREIFTNVKVELNKAIMVKKIDEREVSPYLDLEYSNRVRNFFTYLPKKIINNDDSHLFATKQKIISTISYLHKRYNVESDVDNDQRIDFIIMFLLKYNLNVVDFAVLADMYLNTNKKDEYEKSELIKELKDILVVHGFANEIKGKVKKMEK